MPSTHRDRGDPRGSAPPTPPYVRVRIRRFESVMPSAYGPPAGRPGSLLVMSFRSLLRRPHGLHPPHRTARPIGFLCRNTSMRFQSYWPLLLLQAFVPLPELLCPLLTSALRSGPLCGFLSRPTAATQNRSPGVSSAAFHAQSPNIHFPLLMNMDFSVGRPIVQRWCLTSGSCSSTRIFAPRFFQTPSRVSALALR